MTPRSRDLPADFLASLAGKRILGINPPIYDFAWFDLWSKPVGLLGILGQLRNQGNEVSLLDCVFESGGQDISFGRRKAARVEVEKPQPYAGIPRRYHRYGLNADSIRRRIAVLPPPDVVLVTSAMTYWYPGPAEMIGIARAVCPEAPIILGGSYAKLCPSHAKRLGADFVDRSVNFPPSLPLPMDLYDTPGYGILVTSYGCPMRCGYCASGILWPGYRGRTPDEIIMDMETQLAISGIRDMAFYDDALLLDKEYRLYPLCRHIIRHHPGLRLHTPNGLHVSALDQRCCETLFSAGFHTIRLSLEGIDSQTQNASDGKTSGKYYAHAVRNLQAAGYPKDRIETYVMVGLPGQDLADVRRSIQFVKDLGGRPKLTEFSPIPGTLLYETAVRKTPAIADEPLLHNNSVYPQYVAESPNPDELQEMKDLARS